MPPRPSPTHFLCIPLSGAQLARSIASFRADVTSTTNFANPIPEQAVRPLGTLHLTLGVMSLKDETSISKAVTFLRQLRLRDLLDNARVAPVSAAAQAMGAQVPAQDEPLSVTLQGLQPMQKASQTSVLYAPPTDPTGLLRRFCEGVRRAFMDAGLMVEEDRPLLLHATIVNTIYVKGRSKGRQRMTLDARDVLGRYDDYVWMEGMGVERVAICRMGAKSVEGSEDQVYEVEAEAGFEDGGRI